ncbi:hypothetical protein CUMW_225580 [Citrus unshiu]|uniref:Uncharacterized protein n=1 Tax=Citrus unshiu TaxID=55188 RepID=A0A2H5QFM5_CITUN|nr:hypothetical protein CUMW_225580 [Citrus unshiu]
MDISVTLVTHALETSTILEDCKDWRQGGFTDVLQEQIQARNLSCSSLLKLDFILCKLPSQEDLKYVSKSPFSNKVRTHRSTPCKTIFDSRELGG